MLEKSVEERLRKMVESIGGIAPKFESPGNNGMPDRLVIMPGGRVYLVETKRPKKSKVAKLQKYQQDRLRALGVDVRMLYTYDDVDAFIVEIDK